MISDFDRCSLCLRAGHPKIYISLPEIREGIGEGTLLFDKSLFHRSQCQVSENECEEQEVDQIKDRIGVNSSDAEEAG